MEELGKWVSAYLSFCRDQKGLNEKTIKAYRIDLAQFLAYLRDKGGQISKTSLSGYLAMLHRERKPKTVKRKAASLKAFCSYLTCEELIAENPFGRMKVKFSEPFILPKTVPLDAIGAILSAAYGSKNRPGLTIDQARTTVRDVAILETLFATGMRVTELCSLKAQHVDLRDGTVKIFGKGAKERIVQIGNPDVLAALAEYQGVFCGAIESTGSFFVNRRNRQISDQSVRFMIQKYTDLAGLKIHITPHMFRHSFATLLLEEDVDIRFIQQILGHSSITTTQIYTHVASKKQRDILSMKHPRNRIVV